MRPDSNYVKNEHAIYADLFRLRALAARRVAASRSSLLSFQRDSSKYSYYNGDNEPARRRRHSVMAIVAASGS